MANMMTVLAGTEPGAPVPLVALLSTAASGPALSTAATGGPSYARCLGNLAAITPPGAGTHGLPLKSLFDFERVHVRAGETATVYLYPALSEFAPVMRDDGERHALEGVYRISVGLAETAPLGMGYVTSDVRAL